MIAPPSHEQRTLPKTNRAFAGFFIVYFAGVVGLLVLGLASAFGAISPTFRSFADALGQGSNSTDQIWRAIARAAPLSESVWALALDYTLSALNLAFGAFIVWRRPGDWVARLLGLGMVGTAMAYNFQAHGVLAFLRWFNILHYMYHATSGALYLHALVLFPNGKLVPRRFGWIIGVIYFLMIEETLLPLLKATFGRALFLSPETIIAAPGSLARVGQMLMSVRGGGLVIATLDTIFQIDEPFKDFNSIIEAETTFFVLLFGVLIPIIGVVSQVYRYRAVSSQQERQQTKFVVWALTVSFATGLLLIVLAIIQSVTSRAGFTVGTLEEIEQSIAWIFPPMVSVIPIALLISILRYRLFDIDLVINRTLVYGSLTAILAGGFAASSNILQRVFLAITGSQSEVAVVISALIVAMAFAPIRAWLQNIVDRKFKEVHIPGKELNQFGQQVQSTIDLSGREQILRHFLDTVARAFDVEGGAVFWGEVEPMQLGATFGAWNGIAKITVPLEMNGVTMGKVALGARLNGLDYSPQDVESLQHTANLVARAISVTNRAEKN